MTCTCTHPSTHTYIHFIHTFIYTYISLHRLCQARYRLGLAYIGNYDVYGSQTLIDDWLGTCILYKANDRTMIVHVFYSPKLFSFRFFKIALNTSLHSSATLQTARLFSTSEAVVRTIPIAVIRSVLSFLIVSLYIPSLSVCGHCLAHLARSSPMLKQ